ncbi:hypothetical protein CsSME_00006551 [Camellia sinensis var. sinensis]
MKNAHQIIPCLLLHSLLLHIFSSTTQAKSVIEPCNSNGSCTSLLVEIEHNDYTKVNLYLNAKIHSSIQEDSQGHLLESLTLKYLTPLFVVVSRAFQMRSLPFI